MSPRITLVTLGVDDLERSLVFYRDGLGLPTPGIVGQEFEHGAVVFFELEGGTRLALFQRANLAIDAGISQGPRSSTEFSLGHNVRSAAEVDRVMEQARSADAKVVKEAAATFWGGYAGYFQDPDGHLWEVAYNPQFPSALSGVQLAQEKQCMQCHAIDRDTIGPSFQTIKAVLHRARLVKVIQEGSRAHLGPLRGRARMPDSSERPGR